MRQVVLDTETTGLNPAQGHRMIEIACIELQDRRATGRSFHSYLQPDRRIDDGAFAVHGITSERLEGAPRFADIADNLMGFISGGEIVAHNAPFDMGFLRAELERWGQPHNHGVSPVLDTLALARRMHPGQRNNLDALCKRYNIDNSKRTDHGAMLDAQLLVEVYLAMTAGQNAMEFSDNTESVSVPIHVSGLKVVQAGLEELAAHNALLAEIRKASGGTCLWDSILKKVAS